MAAAEGGTAGVRTEAAPTGGATTRVAWAATRATATAVLKSTATAAAQAPATGTEGEALLHGATR